MLRTLSAARAEFLLVGAYAMAAHGVPRATADLDVWVKRAARRPKDLVDLRLLVRGGAPRAARTTKPAGRGTRPRR